MSMYTPSIRPPHDLHIHRGITQARPPPLFLFAVCNTAYPFRSLQSPAPSRLRPSQPTRARFPPVPERRGRERKGADVASEGRDYDNLLQTMMCVSFTANSIPAQSCGEATTPMRNGARRRNPFVGPWGHGNGWARPTCQPIFICTKPY